VLVADGLDRLIELGQEIVVHVDAGVEDDEERGEVGRVGGRSCSRSWRRPGRSRSTRWTASRTRT
jgi:hypothetical protein